MMEPMDTPEPHPAATLRAMIRQAVATTDDDQALAEAITASGALAEIIGLATASTAETAQLLGIQPDSVRKLMAKSPTFPAPVVDARRFARTRITEYDRTRARGGPRSTEG